MNRAEQNISDLHSILEARAQFQVAFYLEQLKARLKDGKAAVLWDLNNTLFDNFWVRLNIIRALHERNTGYEIEIFENIYSKADASITQATTRLSSYYHGIDNFVGDANEMMERNKIENPIKDPRLPGIIQEMEKVGIRSIGIASGSRQHQLPKIKKLLGRYYPYIKDIPVILYPEWSDFFSHGKSNLLPSGYEYTLLWKQILAGLLQTQLGVPLILVDNEPRQAELVNSGKNIFGVHFNNVNNLRQQIEQCIS